MHFEILSIDVYINCTVLFIEKGCLPRSTQLHLSVPCYVFKTTLQPISIIELTCLFSFLAMTLPIVYGAPTEASENLHPKILEAMKRDLGLNAEQATARVQHDIYASEVIEKVRGSIGSSFAGGWIDASKIFVGVTDKAAADQATAAGAVPVIMSASLDKLESAKGALNKHFASQGEGSKPQSPNIASYFIDVATNKLVVEALDDGRDYAKALGSLANLPESNFEIRRVDQLPSRGSSA